MTRGKEVWCVALLLTVALGALGIRLVRLGSEPFWLDETCTASFNAGTFGRVVTAYAKDIHPPLYAVLLHSWSTVVGGSEKALRGFSTVWSIIGLLVAALLTRDITGSRPAALMAGLLVAVNPLDIWYAQEARMYAQAAALAAMLAWVLWHWIHTGGRTGGSWTSATAFGLLSTMLLYTHYVAAVVVASQVLVAVAIFSVRRRRRDVALVLGAAAASAVLFLPWVGFVHRFRDGLYSAAQVGWIQNPSLGDAFGFLNHEFFLGFGAAPAAAAGWFSVVAGVVLAVIVTAAASAGAGTEAREPQPLGEALAFLFGLVIVPPLLAVTIGDLWHPVYFRPRFSLFCLIPTVVAVVTLLTRVRPPLRTLLVATVAAMMAAGAAWQALAPTKSGLREVAHLSRSFGEPEFVIMLPPPNQFLVHYYLPHSDFQPSQQALASSLHTGRTTTVWVCLQGGQIPRPGSPDGDLVAWLATTGPHRLLGHADGFAVFELQARPDPADYHASSAK